MMLSIRNFFVSVLFLSLCTCSGLPDFQPTGAAGFCVDLVMPDGSYLPVALNRDPSEATAVTEFNSYFSDGPVQVTFDTSAITNSPVPVTNEFTSCSFARVKVNQTLDLLTQDGKLLRFGYGITFPSNDSAATALDVTLGGQGFLSINVPPHLATFTPSYALIDDSKGVILSIGGPVSWLKVEIGEKIGETNDACGTFFQHNAFIVIDDKRSRVSPGEKMTFERDRLVYDFYLIGAWSSGKTNCTDVNGSGSKWALVRRGDA